MPREADLAQAFLDALLETERLSEEELRAYQSGLVESLLDHARANTTFYRDRGLPAGPVDLNGSAWLAIPTTDRKLLSARRDELQATGMPRNHGVLRPVQSGGSTGAPVQVVLSDLDSIGRVVSTYRMFVAYGFDQALPLFMIRNRQHGSGRTDRLVFRKWGFPWLPEEQLGDRIHIDIATPANEQLDRLSARAPAYLNTLPSNILRLGRAARERDARPSIPILISVAEYLGDEVKALAEQCFGSRVINILSSAEGGVIAIQCPETENLHIQSETVLVEILAEDGRLCTPGETGEVVVTPLYNYATPLIRYRSGDFVVKGGPCPCGRANPTIARIVGRREHMFTFPDGSRRIPAIDRVRISDLIGHDAWQFVQTGRDTAEVRHEPSPQARAAEDALRETLQAAIDSAFTVTMSEVPALPVTGGGKRHFCVNDLH